MQLFRTADNQTHYIFEDGDVSTLCELYGYILESDYELIESLVQPTCSGCLKSEEDLKKIGEGDPNDER